MTPSGSYDARTAGKTAELIRYVVTVVVAVVASYFASMNVINQRLAVVETREQVRFEQTQNSLTRIENSMVRIESENRRTLEEWAKGVDRRTLEPLPLQRYVEQQGVR